MGRGSLPDSEEDDVLASPRGDSEEEELHQRRRPRQRDEHLTGALSDGVCVAECGRGASRDSRTLVRRARDLVRRVGRQCRPGRPREALYDACFAEFENDWTAEVGFWISFPGAPL